MKDYTIYTFKNRPTLDFFVNGCNVFISGPCGSGKSVLLHQILSEMKELPNHDDYQVILHDPKCVGFNRELVGSCSFVERRISYQNEIEECISRLNDELNKRKKLSTAELEKLPHIIVMSDEINDYDSLFCFVKEHYLEVNPLKIHFILAAQLRDHYYINKAMYDACKVLKLDVVDGQYIVAIE